MSGYTREDYSGLARRPSARDARRMRLLSSCAVAPLLAVGWPSADAAAQSCATPSGYACYSVQQPAQPADPSSHGAPGTPGTVAPAVTFSLDATTYGGAVAIGSIGGPGGNGRNTHYHELDKNGGDGAVGGAGSTVTITMPAGLVIQNWTYFMAGGGQGGTAGHGSHGGVHGTGGDGGAGGNLVVGSTGAPAFGVITSDQTSLTVSAYGGNGAAGVNFDNASPDSSEYDGGDAGSGGNGGTVQLVFGGTIGGPASIVAAASGGDGGVGGTPDMKPILDYDDNGGNGGNGGTGGTVTVAFAAGAQWATGYVAGTVITAMAYGGQAGAGGPSGGGSGGQAGTGGAGGIVTVQNDGTVLTGWNDAPGILAQSFGGVGANGGKGGGWGAGGGYGGGGGAGNSVTILGGTDGSVSTQGSNSHGILAQSIGGGGGNGGDSNGWEAVGGDGGTAADGGNVTVNTSNTITTTGERANAIFAQSIGGGGGNGGIADGNSYSILDITIGGTAGGGGNAQSVNLASGGLITTSGLHSNGLVLQAIGGGGGNGGAAYGKDSFGVASAQVSIGGKGGDGGTGGTIGLVGSAATNSGQIQTMGNNAHGIVAQSIGGGGGIGGSSSATATTYAVPTDPEPPSISIAIALGGSGGSGGAGQSVTIVNSGLVMTGGAGAHGMLTQSIGGGGGSGGDASASASAQGSGSFNLTTSIALGGTGAGGGDGGSVTSTNSGLIVTAGGQASGMLLQSIGGGGGNGGIGDANANSAIAADYTLTLSLGMGGSGGGGGDGQSVSATNSGAILTMGDGSAGILAQSIGGGGGTGGGGGGAASGSTFSVTVNVGGDGGKGGSTQDGGGVTVQNSGTITTFGADSAGIHAQSIAGGGGAGGKTASNIGSPVSRGDGGVSTAGTVDSAFDSLLAAYRKAQSDPNNPDSQDPAAAYNDIVALLGVGYSLLGKNGQAATDDVLGLLTLAGELSTIYQDEKYVPTLSLSLGIGGKGGAGGQAGPVTVTNTGSIGTMGSMSDAIIAQSVGGGGGKGGASSTNSSDQVDGQVEVSLGGSGGAGGAGGAVIVTNSGELITIGGHSAGIVAQSIGGGGGIGGVAGATSTADTLKTVLSIPVSIGGSGGGNSSASTVSVTNSANITTQSHNSIGIIAQSIAGGGGIMKSFSLAPGDNNGGSASVTGGSFGIDGFHFGGSGGASGNPNTVTVTHGGGTISTGGRNAYGILAQSIGGGGGLSLGGLPTGNSFFGTGQMNGAGGQISVTVNGNASIATTGIGAVGIFAQSIGGGGGLAGDTGLTAQRAAFASSSSQNGSGSTVAISVASGSSVTTSGSNAPALLLQSIGGGGGRVTNSGYGAYSGTAGGIGYGGPIQVTVGGTVQATGAASQAIYAEIAGQSGAPSTSVTSVTVNPGGVVSGGTDFNAGDGYGAGVYLVGGGTSAGAANTIDNSGTITSVNGTGGTAIYGTGGYTQVTNQSTGTISGSINLSNGGGSGNVTNNGGTLNTGAQVALGASGVLRNAGTMHVGATRQITATTLTGTLQQGSGGLLVLDTDHAAGRSDSIAVQGRAELAGRIEARPITLSKTAVTVMSASGGIALDPAATGYRSHVFDLRPVSDGTSLHIQPIADFNGSGGLNANQSQVAGHLREAWDRGESLGTGFATLAGIRDGASYGQALNSISAHPGGAIASSRFSASHAFVNTMHSCPDLGEAAPGQRERDCVWGRITGNTTIQDSQADALGYRSSAVVAQIGGQYQFRPDWFLGGSLAYENSRFSGGRGTSTVTGDAVLGGVVLKHQHGGWLFSGALDAGYGSYDSTRRIVLGDALQFAEGSPKAWHLGATARVSYRMDMGDWYVKPIAELRLAHLNAGSYTESGASPFRLAVSGSSATMLTATGSVEIGTRIDLGSFGTLLPFASVGFSVSGEDGWSSAASFAALESATAGFRTTTPIPSTLGRVSVGANLATPGNLELKLQYSGDFGDRYSSHTGLARVAYRF